MNKRGQVFLMAAIILAGILVGLVRLSNQGTVREEPEAFYDLGDEIGFETRRVLDHGIINGVPSIDLASQLLNNYSELISNEDVAFVYGDYSDIKAYYFQNVNVIGVSLGTTFIPLSIRTGTPVQAARTPTSATIRIRGNDYTFNLKPGQNFYFVLIKEEDGEQFVKIE